jgi:hypothetical protein
MTFDTELKLMAQHLVLRVIPWGALKKIAPCGGRCENFGVFLVKNFDFTPKNHIFSIFRGEHAPGVPLPGSIPVVYTI